jgi:hypothetical protein
MEKIVQILMNKHMRSQSELMFGEGFFIKVNYVGFSTQKKCYVIDVTLKCPNIKEEDFVSFYPDALELIINDSWIYTGLPKKILLTSSVDI